jgi:hypothetical protein
VVGRENHLDHTCRPAASRRIRRLHRLPPEAGRASGDLRRGLCMVVADAAPTRSRQRCIREDEQLFVFGGRRLHAGSRAERRSQSGRRPYPKTGPAVDADPRPLRQSSGAKSTRHQTQCDAMAGSRAQVAYGPGKSLLARRVLANDFVEKVDYVVSNTAHAMDRNHLGELVLREPTRLGCPDERALMTRAAGRGRTYIVVHESTAAR